MTYMKRLLADRKKAFEEAVVNDDFSYFRKYCKKYGAPIPEDEKVMKAGIYKAVQVCIDISEEVKETAFLKCVELGFSPLIMPYMGGDEE